MDKKFLKQLKDEYGINVCEVIKIEENEVFSAIRSKLDKFVNKSPLKSILLYEESEMNSIVESKKGYFTLKHQPSITFFLLDGSHLRFSPDNKQGIEITRVSVTQSNRRAGLGTFLMNAFQSLCYFALGHLPYMTLECTGAIGFGENKTNTPLNSQIKFFQGFGFKIKKRFKSGYVLMEYKGDNMTLLSETDDSK